MFYAKLLGQVLLVLLLVAGVSLFHMSPGMAALTGLIVWVWLIRLVALVVHRITGL